MRPKRVLILGGTQEALALAEALSSRPNIDIVTSLAGVTQDPVLPKGEVRKGGFGGVEGMAAYFAEEEIALVVDATHPFATQISSNAVLASEQVGICYVRLERPQWAAREGDRWIEVSIIADAIKALPIRSSVFLTLGRKDLGEFLDRKDLEITARMIEPPEIAIPDNVKIIFARPPFYLEDEKKLMRENRTEYLVTKNSGGNATSAKLAAARELGITVVIIQRPKKPDASVAASVEDIVKLVEGFI